MMTPTKPNLSAPYVLAALLVTTPIASSAEPDSAPSASGREQVEVYRPDGSIQCQAGGAIALEQMRMDLTEAGIPVHAERKADDGLMRPAVCGADTGAINIYSIDADWLEAAIAQGFRPNLPDQID